MISIEPSNLLFFISASLLLIIAPGPDIVFLVTQGVTHGPRAGLATAMGLAAGNLVHTTAAALGVSVIVRASQAAFHTLKIAGVSYLLYLAWKTLTESRRVARDAAQETTAGLVGETMRAADLFRRGLFMNILNPKVALFFLAFLPQFASAHAGPIGQQMALYGILFTFLVVVVFGAIGFLAGGLSARLRRAGSGTAARRFGWVVALVYLALAVRLAMVRS
ncbi:MAG TPA: LysE family translocator [Candidatus Eisenbacteria bacterium]|nr:LysE family translocator [Candidatus Eisenbacteria bacterium]